MCPYCRKFKSLGYSCSAEFDGCDCPKCQGFCLCSIWNRDIDLPMVEDIEPNPYSGTYSEE
jgi:hypothetical protein